MRIHAGLLDALHDRSAKVVNPLRAAKRPRRREALTFFDHVELSGGYGFVNAHKYGDKSINTYNLGAKVKFLDENAFDTSWMPALAVGGVYKYTDSRTVDALGLDDDGFDAYVVASKLITQTPWPILVSAGLLHLLRDPELRHRDRISLVSILARAHELQRQLARPRDWHKPPLHLAIDDFDDFSQIRLCQDIAHRNRDGNSHHHLIHVHRSLSDL